MKRGILKVLAITLWRARLLPSRAWGKRLTLPIYEWWQSKLHLSEIGACRAKHNGAYLNAIRGKIWNGIYC